MAESVDALVSNTSGVTSIPVRPRVWVREKYQYLADFVLCSLFPFCSHTDLFDYLLKGIKCNSIIVCMRRIHSYYPETDISITLRTVPHVI